MRNSQPLQYDFRLKKKVRGTKMPQMHLGSALYGYELSPTSSTGASRKHKKKLSQAHMRVRSDQLVETDVQERHRGSTWARTSLDHLFGRGVDFPSGLEVTERGTVLSKRIPGDRSPLQRFDMAWFHPQRRIAVTLRLPKLFQLLVMIDDTNER